MTDRIINGNIDKLKLTGQISDTEYGVLQKNLFFRTIKDSEIIEKRELLNWLENHDKLYFEKIHPHIERHGESYVFQEYIKMPLDELRVLVDNLKANKES